jgi:hypothetical protein
VRLLVLAGCASCKKKRRGRGDRDVLPCTADPCSSRTTTADRAPSTSRRCGGSQW